MTMGAAAVVGRTVLTVAGLLIITGGAVDAQKKVSAKCANRWPNDVQMQMRCSGIPIPTRPPAPPPPEPPKPEPPKPDPVAVRARATTECAARWPNDAAMQTNCVQLAMGERSMGASDLCVSRWPSDLMMQRRCMEVGSRPVDARYSGILAHCEKEWPVDFSMQKFCIERQGKAVDDLGSRDMSAGAMKVIRDKCTADWPDDFAMRNFCEERQIEAFRSIRR